MSSNSIYENLEKETENAQVASLEPFPPTWEPKEGAVITGKVIRIQPNAKTQYGPRAVYTLLDERNGEKTAVFASQTVLRNELERLAPRIGEIVSIRCLGDVAKQSGNGTYKSFVVKVAGRPAEASQQQQAQAAGAKKASSAKPAASDDEVPF